MSSCNIEPSNEVNTDTDLLDLTNDDKESTSNQKISAKMIACGVPFHHPHFFIEDRPGAPAFWLQKDMGPRILQKNELERYGNRRELLILRDKNTKFDSNHIIDFVNSFEFSFANKGSFIGVEKGAFFVKRAGARAKIIEFWKSTKSKYCFVPLQYGTRRLSHFIGMAIDIKKRQIIIYNPSVKLPGRKTKETKEIEFDGFVDIDPVNIEEGTTIKEDELVDKQSNILLYGSMVPMVKGIYKEILEIEKKCGLPPVTWRVHVVRNFIQQQNDKDCGVFVMFLFQTLALGNSVILPHKDLCKNELDNFREWVAFLIFIGRIQRD